jgi:2-keto-4-pentenoate hydratase/2-oxohepta-3-ene-1,7-dioic acid hydratase in catechol pathway
MKFVSYATGDQYAVGLMTRDGQSLQTVRGTESDKPDGMLRLIDRWEELRPEPSMLRGHTLSLEDVRLLAPIPRPPRNVFCVGKNYTEHAKEFSGSGYDTTGSPDDQPKRPIFFTKAPSSVLAPGGLIESHAAITEEIDYEAELGAIIGRRGRTIPRGQALDYVWGYTILNDVTARDLQRAHEQWFLGKSLDTFCPMGPWAVTADEIDVGELDITCSINGEVRQSSNTSALIFDVPTIIETLSAGITLEPGDIIATGTPEGVGIGFNPPRFLRTGDEIVINISGLGTLQNTMA